MGKEKGLTIMGAAILIAGEMAGSGVLALPKAVVDAGWAGVVMMVVFCINSSYGGTRLAKCWEIIEERHPDYRGACRAPYGVIAEEAMGRFGRYLASICIWITLFGIGTVYLLQASQIVQELLKCIWPNASHCIWLLIFASIITPPMWLGSPKDFWIEVHDLKKLSCTEIQQQWGKLSKESLLSYEPQKIADLSHVKEKILPYPKTSDSVTLDENFKEELFSYILEGFQDSTLNQTLRGVGEAPEEQSTIDPELVDTIVTTKCPLLLPMDAVDRLGHSMDEAEKVFFEEHVQLSPEDAAHLCICTLSQWKSSTWKKARSYRITGSNCYSLFTYSKKKGRSPEDWETKIKSTFFPAFTGSAATRYGAQKEDTARNIFRNCKGVEIIQLGLVVNIFNPWFGYSPDGIYFENNNGREAVLVEIKCPLKGKKKNGMELLKSLRYINFSDGNFTLKKNHAYYGQIQLGLALLNLKKCDLIIYSNVDDSIIVLSVPRDEYFLRIFLPTLSQAYFDKLLPEFVKYKDILYFLFYLVAFPNIPIHSAPPV